MIWEPIRPARSNLNYWVRSAHQRFARNFARLRERPRRHGHQCIDCRFRAVGLLPAGNNRQCTRKTCAAPARVARCLDERRREREVRHPQRPTGVGVRHPDESRFSVDPDDKRLTRVSAVAVHHLDPLVQRLLRISAAARPESQVSSAPGRPRVRRHSPPQGAKSRCTRETSFF